MRRRILWLLIGMGLGYILGLADAKYYFDNYEGDDEYVTR